MSIVAAVAVSVVELPLHIVAPGALTSVAIAVLLTVILIGLAVPATFGHILSPSTVT
ncbi:hypothetical protein D3C78_885720 [compost metagenome]